MKRLVASGAFFVVLSCVACAEGEGVKVASGDMDEFARLVIAMLAAFAAGVALAVGYRRK